MDAVEAAAAAAVTVAAAAVLPIAFDANGNGDVAAVLKCSSLVCKYVKNKIMMNSSQANSIVSNYFNHQFLHT